MNIGCIGLGKMGNGIALRLLEHGYAVVGFDAGVSVAPRLPEGQLRMAASIRDLVEKLPVPRVIWVMVPHEAVDAVAAELLVGCGAGDIVIDGGNSLYKNSMRRAEEFSRNDIRFLDVGVSGGPTGARNGSCLMIGGDKRAFESCEQLFRDLAHKDGYAYVGGSGAGHFVKMVHNGIEYGMMQAIAEGFALLNASSFPLDVSRIATLYNHGSVIESRLTGWLADAYVSFGAALAQKECCSPEVGMSGEGEWSIQAAEEFSVEVPVMRASVDARVTSRAHPSYQGRVLSALRYKFGGHAASPEGETKK